MNPLKTVLDGTLGRVIDKLTDHFLPAKLSEKEREEFRLKARELVVKEVEQDIRVIEAVNQTMQAEARSEHWLQWSWRPIVGLTFSAVIINNYILIPLLAVFGLEGPEFTIPQELWSAMLVVLGVSAGTRGLEKWQRAKNRG